jgi:hypothetical protein
VSLRHSPRRRACLRHRHSRNECGSGAESFRRTDRRHHALLLRSRERATDPCGPRALHTAGGFGVTAPGYRAFRRPFRQTRREYFPQRECTAPRGGSAGAESEAFARKENLGLLYVDDRCIRGIGSAERCATASARRDHRHRDQACRISAGRAHRRVSAAGGGHRRARPHSVRRLPEHRTRREFPGRRPWSVANPHARHRCERRRRRSRERSNVFRRDRHERHQPVRRQAESSASRHRSDRGVARSAGHTVRRERPGGRRAHRPRAGGSEQLRAQCRHARFCDGSFRRRELSRRSRHESAAHRGSVGGTTGGLPGRHRGLHRQRRPGQPCRRLDGAGRRVSGRTHRVTHRSSRATPLSLTGTSIRRTPGAFAPT